MKDFYFSDAQTDDDNDVSVLTEEERAMIRRYRAQKMQEMNDGTYASRPVDAKSVTSDLPRVDESMQAEDYAARYRAAQQHAQAQRQSAVQAYYEDPDTLGTENPLPARRPAPKKKKKKGCGCGCLGAAVTALFLVCVIAFVGTFGYVYSLMNKTQQTDLQATPTYALRHSSDVMNILLIGLDEDQNGTSRSDTMMLLSIDKANKMLKLTSFLRDMWVEIPDHGSAKLNAAYAYGGTQLTVDTIESNFRVNIDHAMLVNFDMFRQIIDALGGITVDITEKEADFINRTTSVTVTAGENRLDGKKALIYARIRKLDSDFNRTQRQRKVVAAMVECALIANPLTLLPMLSDIMPLLTTDMSAMQLTTLAFGALRYIRFDIDQLQIPADHTYVSKTIRGQAALVPDLEQNKQNLITFLYGTGD